MRIKRRNGGRRFVVKVQRPLSSNVENPPALVYNEDRSVLAEFPFDGALRRMMGKSLKQYRWAYMRGTVLHLEGQAPEQEW